MQGLFQTFNRLPSWTQRFSISTSTCFIHEYIDANERQALHVVGVSNSPLSVPS